MKSPRAQQVCNSLNTRLGHGFLLGKRFGKYLLHIDKANEFKNVTRRLFSLPNIALPWAHIIAPIKLC
jgi:hypothetical protein